MRIIKVLCWVWLAGVHSAPSTLLWPHTPLLNGSKSRLPPAAWWAARLVAARPVGVFKANGPLHPPASALPLHSQESPSLWWSLRTAPGPRFATGTLFPTGALRSAVWSSRWLPDSICSPRAVPQTKETFPPFSVTCRLHPEDPEPITAQCAQVDCSAGTVHQQHRDYHWFQFRRHRERSVGIGFCSMTFKPGSEFEFRKL